MPERIFSIKCPLTHPLGSRQNYIMRKQYYWKLTHKIASEVYLKCHFCPIHNPGKTIYSSKGHFPLTLGPFEVLQMGFNQLPPS